MKDDERQFLLAVSELPPKQYPRDIIAQMPIHYKRCWYLLEKWGGKGWYEWGVSIDLGWLTEKGITKAKTLLEDA